MNSKSRKTNFHIIFLMKSFLQYCDERQSTQQHDFRRNYFMMQSVAMYANVFMISFLVEFSSFDAFLLFETLKDSLLFDSVKLILTNVTKWANDMIDALSFDRTNIFKIMIIIWWTIINLLVSMFFNNNSTTFWFNEIERVELSTVRQF